MLRFIFRERTNRRTLLAGILLSAVIIALSSTVAILTLQDHLRRSQQQEIGRIGKLISLDLIGVEDIPGILLEPDHSDYEVGLEALRPFGYETASSPVSLDEQRLSLVNFSVYVVVGSGFSLIILWTALLAFLSKKHSDFLKSVSLSLDTLMSGRFESTTELEIEGESAVVASLLGVMSRRYEKTLKQARFERNKMRAFISFISHELKTPIASLKTMNELVIGVENMPRDQILEFMTRSQKDIERMEWLVNDVLNIARIEAGTVRFSLKKHDLRRLTLEVAERYSGIARTKDVSIEIEADSEVLVFCDERWLSQSIDNILKNAIDYSPAGGTVFVEISPGEAYVRLCIADEGPGVSPEEASAIFQGFYRGSAAAKIKKGTGLGLALSKAVITRHGGDIRLKSVEGKGSVFIIELPARMSS